MFDVVPLTLVIHCILVFDRLRAMVPGQELRRRVDHLGQTLWNFPARDQEQGNHLWAR